ncbi:polyhydroxyalkanoic acid system family protein [Candidatus Kaiserbacteria bacterium]|nr:polyhydroxyalkanoic acid system family protein [Candidatus Kaiserbacteria bacterium]
MHFKVPHKSTKFRAGQKLRDAITHARPMAKENNVTIDEEKWEGNTLHFAITLQGKQITGTLVIDDKDFIIDAKLPFLWRLFEGKIERTIAEQVKTMQ